MIITTKNEPCGCTIAAGKPVLRQPVRAKFLERLTRAVTLFNYPSAMIQTIKTNRVTEDDFQIKAHRTKKQVRVLLLANETITSDKIMPLPTRDGCTLNDVAQDVVRVPVINWKS